MHKSANVASLKISTDVWRTLPSQLKRLEVDMELFESEECFLALPALKKFFLTLDGEQELVDRIAFSEPLKGSLNKFVVYNKRFDSELNSASLILKLNDFSSLCELRIHSSVFLKSDTLSSLPKTLVTLQLSSARFENFGLPKDQSRQSSDWKDGALSRLPEGLEVLELTYSRDLDDELIDFMLFSRLPQRLSKLSLRTQHCFSPNPKSFIASCPKRLDCFIYT